MINAMKTKIKHIIIAIWLAIKEKTFRDNNTRLKYLLFKGKGDALIISFSAYNKEKALYNYIRTLNKTGLSRLYIKDDFAPDHKGSYYLGEKGKHNVEKAVCELINYYRKKLGLTSNAKLIFIGSSKGGYAALNFSTMYDNSYAIVGAPQYLLGSHLNEPFFFKMLEDIVGERTQKNIEELDRHIHDKILSNKLKNRKVFLQFSDKEYTYEKHIKFLVEDLKESNIDFELSVLDYFEHSDVHKFFPKYLQEKVLQIINEK